MFFVTFRSCYWLSACNAMTKTRICLQWDVCFKIFAKPIYSTAIYCMVYKEAGYYIFLSHACRETGVAVYFYCYFQNRQSATSKKEPKQQQPQPCAGIFKQSMVARNRVVISLSYRPARRHSLAELVPWNRFLGSLKVKNSGSVQLSLFI